jgi:16S rRNA A1518/A1519 N6-dimethyltransferase RsmA/KsgA/DIM1 with predicted DNA glycosylase/AP lyase activity
MMFAIMLLLLIVLLIALSFIWPPDSPWAPQWQINTENSDKVVKFSKITKDDYLYELGCGTGAFILTAVTISQCKAFGVEIDPARFLISYIRAKISRQSRNITIVRKDFKHIDLSPATVVYMYLIPEAMKKLLPQFKKQLRKGTKIVSYRYQIPLDPSEKKIHLVKSDSKILVYQYEVM